MAQRDPLFDDSDEGPARRIPADGGRGKDRDAPRGKRRGLLGRLFGRRASAGGGRLHRAERSRVWGLIRWVAVVLLVFVLLYYPVGMMIMHRVGDDPDFSARVTEGQSHAVAVTAALIDREVNTHGWLPNDPFFYPSWMLDNGPNFQRGMIAAMSRFAIEMADKIGRSRGSSSIDPDLEQASGDLKYSPNIWVVSGESSTIVTQSSESKYRAGRRALIRYNQRLAQQQAVFDIRADNLQTFVDRVNSDLGSQSAIIERHVRERGGDFFDTTADNIFYETKGRLYTYFLILRELGRDFDEVVQDRQMQNNWERMLTSLREAAVLQPLVVRNGAPDGMLQPNHLTAQGFYLLRVRTQLKEISDILLR